MNTKILDRVRALAFPPNVGQLKYVHILDLDKKGYIKPHIDAVRVWSLNQFPTSYLMCLL